MNTAALREQIQKAQQHEAETGLLTRQLESKLPHLHPSIQLPEADAKGVLTRFVAAYINEVPDLLDAANEVAREAGIESQIKPVLKIDHNRRPIHTCGCRVIAGSPYRSCYPVGVKPAARDRLLQTTNLNRRALLHMQSGVIS